MTLKTISIASALALIGFNLLQSYITVSSNQLIALGVLAGFAMAALGITEYFFGNPTKKFEMQEVLIGIAMIVGILVAITFLFPQFTFGNNIFIKQAFAGVS